MVDTVDSKSTVFADIRVQVPSPVEYGPPETQEVFFLTLNCILSNYGIEWCYWKYKNSEEFLWHLALSDRIKNGKGRYVSR